VTDDDRFSGGMLASAGDSEITALVNEVMTWGQARSL
jgi:hypothetical protein